MRLFTSSMIVGIGIGLVACSTEENQQTSNQENMKYPTTRKDSTVVDEYFGIKVADPYRWLEDDMSEETAEWVKAENELTFDYLKKIPYRQTIIDRITKLWNYEKFSAPFEYGNYTYFYKNDGLQAQSVLMRFPKGKTQKEADVFLDPNQFSKDGTTSLGEISFSKDGSLCAYQISEGGSDWRKVIILNTESKSEMEDTLIDVKFSEIAWKENNGFYYSSYDKPKEGSTLSGKTEHHKLYYHTLGTKQSEDQLIFGGEQTPRRYISANITENGDFLIISAATSTTGNELYFKDLRNEKSKIINIISNFENTHGVLHSEGDFLFTQTNLNAPNNKLVKINTKDFAIEKWEEIIPEGENVMSISTAGGYFFASFLEHALTKVNQYDTKGVLIREVELPAVGTASGFNSKWEDASLYYSFTSYVYPSTIFKFDIKNGKSELYKKSDVDFDPEQYESKQVFYNSKDGTKVPLIITYKKGIHLDGNNPTILYGYGGFNISLEPYFSTANIVFLEHGGIYAVANLRGGGEYGEKWHKAGTQLQKQNVFDDFIAAAEYLIENKYTSSEKLAIMGGSNGGLLVGAVMTQRPELMKVALPAVGVLDMLRYHKFTAGAGWAYDYGTSEDNKEMFEYLLGYSPCHNVQKDVSYPATMITTGDHDDRVVPAHSFKFAAELQEKHKGENPVLIRIETNAGHGAGKPTHKIIEERADIFAFTFWNMGIKELK